MAAGRVLAGRYELREQLGRGGMGVVWTGWDTVIHRTVAVKTVDLLDEADSAETFLREARTAGSLSHTGIVTVHDIGTDGDGTVFLVMELIAGRNLSQVLRSDGIPELAVAVDWAAQIAEALACAHDGKVVHRDLKPANVMLTGAGRLKLLDFGIARAVSATTQASRMIGTPAYMAPERLQGKAGGTRADLYALGCLLYELLTGRAPFPHGDFAAMMLAHLMQEAPAPSSLCAGIPGELDRLVADLLHKDPRRRPETAHDVRDRLRGVVTGRRAGAVPVRLAYPPTVPVHVDTTLTAVPVTASGTAREWTRAASADTTFSGAAGEPPPTVLADPVAIMRAHFDLRRKLVAARKAAGSADPRTTSRRFAELVREHARLLGPDDPDLLAVRGEHAQHLWNAGDRAAAVRLHTALVADHVRALGSTHQLSLVARSRHAHYVGEAGDRLRAVELSSALVEDCVRVLGRDHPQTLVVRSQQAYALGESGERKGAAHRYEAIVDSCVRVLGRYPRDTLVARCYHAFNLGATGRRAEAAWLCTGLVEDCVRVLGRVHGLTDFAERIHAHHTGRWESEGRRADALRPSSEYAPRLRAAVPS
ncbi:serine/threonine-protein kinase [Kitasatospora sp. NPDC051914]|uniref:serine/threonine-protein kinase n=1 Tax=Kitasatospora sp. NPDC051914 TaxID=3154945 RepID=UPI0034232E20